MTGFAAPGAGRSISTHLGLSMREVAVPGSELTGIDGVAPAATHLRGPGGNVSAGVLLTMIDSVGGLAAGLAVLPEWVVSTNLMMTTARFDQVGPFAVTGRILRAGRKAVVSSVQVTDEGRDGALVADGVLTSAVLAPADGPPVWTRPLVLDASAPGPTPAPDLDEFFGIAAEDARTVVMPLAEHLRNPWGILHGGATAVLVEAAAGHVTGGDGRVADAVVHFLAPGRVGPVAARAEPVGERPDGDLVEVSVHDLGADDRRMAVAVVTVRGPRETARPRG